MTKQNNSKTMEETMEKKKQTIFYAVFITFFVLFMAFLIFAGYHHENQKEIEVNEFLKEFTEPMEKISEIILNADKEQIETFNNSQNIYSIEKSISIVDIRNDEYNIRLFRYDKLKDEFYFYPMHQFLSSLNSERYKELYSDFEQFFHNAWEQI